MKKKADKVKKQKNDKIFERDYSIKAMTKAMADTLRMVMKLNDKIVPLSFIRAFSNSFYQLIAVLLSAKVVDLLVGKASLNEILIAVLFGIGGILVLNTISTFIEKAIQVNTARCNVLFEFRTADKALNMDYDMLESPTATDIRLKIQEDRGWGSDINSIALQFYYIGRVTGGFVASIFMLWPLFTSTDALFSWDFYVIMFSCIALTLTLRLILRPKLQKRYDEITGEKSSLLKRTMFFTIDPSMMEYRSGKDIRIFAGQDLICDSIIPGIKERDQKCDKLGLLHGLEHSSWSISTVLSKAFSYLYLGIKAASNAITLGGLLRYASGIYEFVIGICKIINVSANFEYIAMLQKNTMEYMAIENRMIRGTLPIDKKENNDYVISFNNVSYKYPGNEEYALRDFSLELRAGTKMSVVGMNGSGKTTMIKLLCRLYDPTEGDITLNGVDIKKYDYEQYMSLFSVVFQDFTLFSLPLGQNIAAGINVDNERAIECLKKVGLEDRFNELPHGLDTYLYKNFDKEGVEISGGEAQKIALARALYKDAPFIVLDEPTAALDPIAEYEIYTRFNEIVGDKTAIYISHRLSSCRFCNDIAVFHKGALVQRGSHDGLIKDIDSKYYQLWTAQAQYYTKEA
jgi:ATP-binding cassette subfamily B protein